MGLGALPILLGAPLGGLVSERFKKKPLLMGIYAYQATLVVIFATLVMTDNAHTWTIFTYVFLMGMIWTIHDPARMSLLTSIIPRKSILNAMALNSLAFSIMRLIIPALGGLLLAYIGPGPLFFGQVLLILGTALTVLLLKNKERQEPLVDNKTYQRVIPELKKGIEHISQQPAIVVLLILNILMMVSIVPFLSGLMPVYAAEVFLVGPKGLGLLISGAGFGSLIGTTILASIGTIKNPIRIAFLIMGAMSLLMLCISFVDSFTLALPFIMVFSGLLMCYFSIASSTVQRVLEDRFRGRVTGIYMMATGLMPIGSLVAGGIANILGAQFATGIGAGSSLIALVVIIIVFRPLWYFTNEVDSPSKEILDQPIVPQPSIKAIPAAVSDS
jgi:predicted MFS family arabinose efflux permease